MLRQKIPALQTKHQSGLLSFQHPRACVHAERAQQFRRAFFLVFGFCGQSRVCLITLTHQINHSLLIDCYSEFPWYIDSVAYWHKPAFIHMFVLESQIDFIFTRNQRLGV